MTNEHVCAHTYMHKWSNIRTFGITSDVKLIKHAASSLVSKKKSIYLSGGSHIEFHTKMAARTSAQKYCVIWV